MQLAAGYRLSPGRALPMCALLFFSHFSCSVSLLQMPPLLLGESCVYSTARRMQFLCKQRHKFQWLNNKTLARADKANLQSTCVSRRAGGCQGAAPTRGGGNGAGVGLQSVEWVRLMATSQHRQQPLLTSCILKSSGTTSKRERERAS